MSGLPKKPVDVFDVFDYAVRHHFRVLKKILALIILMAFVQALIVYTDHFVLNRLHWVIKIVGAVPMLFFTGALLYQAQMCLEEHESSLLHTLQVMLQRCIAFFMCAVLLTLLVVLYYFLVLQIMRVWIHPTGAEDGSIKGMLIFMGMYMIPTLIFIVFMIFALPLTIVDRLNPLKAMARSYVLIGTRWLQAFTVYACLGMMYILVTPNTLHAHFLIRYHLFMPFVFVMYLIFVPFIVNYLLFMLNDLKLRWAAQVDF